MRAKILKSRSEIVTAAAELFSKNGYRATTMNEVARRLAVSKPTLYASFGNKEALLAEVIGSWINSADESLQSALGEGADAREKLTTLIRSWSRNAASHQAFYRVFLADERELPVAFVAKYKRWSRKALHRIRDCVRAGQSEGVLRADLDATVIAFAMVSFINAIPQWFAAAGRLSIEQIAQDYVSVFEAGVLVASRSSKPGGSVPRDKAKLKPVVDGKS